MAKNPIGNNSNRGVFIFLMNHFQTPDYHLLKRIFPKKHLDVIRNVFISLNSYETIKNKIDDCYCTFVVPEDSWLLDRNGNPNEKASSTNKIKLGIIPSVIALDFIGVEEENDEGVRGIIRDLLQGNLTIQEC